MITIQQIPNVLSPAFNDAIYIVSSDNISQDNFRFVADIYIDSVLVNRKIVDPHPVHQTGRINIRQTIEQTVSHDVDTGLADDKIQDCFNSYNGYSVRFGEQYGASGTIFSDLITATSGSIWNGIFDYLDFCDLDASNTYDCSSTGLFLTNKPTSGDIYIDDNAWLYWVNTASAAASAKVRVITYDSNNSVIGTFIISNAIVGKDAFFGGVFRIPAGGNLNDISNTYISGGTQPILTASVAKYSFQVLNTVTNFPLSNIYYFTIAGYCSEFDKTNMVFQNKLGGYDTFSFIKANKQMSSIERSNYKKGLGSYGNANSFTYSKSDRGNTQFNTKITDRYTVQSDWVSEETLEWLEELVTSPDVYLDNGTNLIPINISNPVFDHKQTLTDKLFNLSVDYSFSFERYRQRR